MSASVWVRRTLWATAAVLLLAVAFVLWKQGRESWRAWGDYLVEDEVTWFFHRPNLRRRERVAWPEHPKGYIRKSTNNLGFCESEDTPELKPPGTRRFLVTGDSHTDGVVFNSESFPNQLEVLLNQGRTRPVHDVLNAGVGFYGPQHYLAVLRKFLYLKPDAYIIGFYTGNDFLDAVRHAREHDGLDIPSRPSGYKSRLKQTNKTVGGQSITAQAFNQIYFFKFFPAMRRASLAITQECLGRIRDICAERGISLIVALMPAKPDVEWDSDAQRLEAVRSLMELSEEDLRINQELTQSLAAWLARQGIAHLDATGPMRERAGALFWKEDYHLSTDGHRVFAELLFERHRKLLE